MPDTAAILAALDRPPLACGRSGCQCRRSLDHGISRMRHCPCHADADPSLSVTAGPKLLVHCQAGCDQQAVWAALGELKGSSNPRSLAPPRRAPASTNSKTVASAAVAKTTRQEIKDAAGVAQAVHVREDLSDGSKRFRWEGPDGTPGLGGQPVSSLPLYGVHQLQDHPDAAVVLAEGEKAADALRDAPGLVALGTVTGASGTPDPEVLRVLVGRTAYLWPDHDDAGRAHMQRIADVLRGLGVEVRMITWEDAPPGGDAENFVAMHGTGEALDRLLTAAIPYTEDPVTGPVLVRAADVVPQRVRWLWPGRVPLGKLTVLDGDPNLGKSLLALDVAARLTRGAAMPDGSRSDLDGPRGVVLLSAEDDPADTIRPRLDAAGADVTRVALLPRIKDPGGEHTPTVADIGALEESIARMTATLVIVDPLMAYVPDGRDTHRDQDVRRGLAPLAALAARTGATVLVIRHLNKAGVGNPLYRGGGSIGIIGAARSGLLVAPDPDEPDSGRRILAVTKANLAAVSPALAYRVEVVDDAPRIAWAGSTRHTAEGLLAARLPEDERSALDEAVSFLREGLAAEDRSAAEMKAEARQAGIAERTLDRARHPAGVVVRRQGFGPGAAYLWHLDRPEPAPMSAMSATMLANNGELGEHDGRGLSKALQGNASTMLAKSAGVGEHEGPCGEHGKHDAAEGTPAGPPAPPAGDKQHPHPAPVSVGHYVKAGPRRYKWVPKSGPTAPAHFVCTRCPWAGPEPQVTHTATGAHCPRCDAPADEGFAVMIRGRRLRVLRRLPDGPAGLTFPDPAAAHAVLDRVAARRGLAPRWQAAKVARLDATPGGGA